MKSIKNVKIKIGKRVLALFLVMAMLFMCFPAAAFAGEADETNEADGGTSLTGGETAQETPAPDQENTTPTTQPDVPADNASTTAGNDAATEQSPETTQAGETTPTDDTAGTTPTAAPATESTPDGTQPTETGKTAPTADEAPMRAAAKAPEEQTEFEIKVEYLFVHQRPQEAEQNPEEITYPADAVTYEVEKDAAFYAQVKFPSIAGYTVYYAVGDSAWNGTLWNKDHTDMYKGDDLDPKNTLEITIDPVGSDVTYYVIYVPTEVTYTVKLMKQDAEGDGYTFFNKFTQNAILGESVSVIDCSDKITDGFHQINYTAESGDTAFQPLANGSTTVEVMLNRNLHNLTFDCDGGSGMENVTEARYGAELTVSNPTKDGYIFKGWTVTSTAPVVTDTAVTDALTKDANNGRVTVPDFDVTFTAQWQQEAAVTANYTIIYYVQSAKEGEDDVYLEYAKEIKADGIAGRGKTVTNTSLPSGDSLGSYVTFNSTQSGGNSVTKTIKADGTTVFKRYFDRKRYTLRFNVIGSLDGSRFSTEPKLTVGSTDYTMTYSFNRKYGDDISTIWPVKFNQPVTTGGLFGGTRVFKWLGRTSGNVIIYNNPMRLTSRLIESSTANSITSYDAQWSSSWPFQADRSYTVMYYYENANGNYVLNSSQTQTIAYSVIDSYNLYNKIENDAKERIPEGYDEPKVTGPTGNSTTVKVEYPRYQYKIYYINTDLTASSVYYEAARGNLPATPAKAGYTFVGWYSDPELANKIENTAWAAQTMPAHDLYVYAKWRKNPVRPVTVKVYLTEEDMTDGELLTEIKTDEGSAAVPDQAVSSRSRDGYIFIGWKYKVNGAETEFVFNSTPVSRNISVYGTWISEENAQCAYTVRHVLYGTDTDLIPPSAAVTVTYGTSVTVAADETLIDQGYTPVQSSITKIITQSNEEFVFQYTDKQITVKFIPVVDGRQVDWKGNTVSQHVYSGGAHFDGTLDSEAVADDAFTFDGWYSDYTCETHVPGSLIADQTFKLQLPNTLFTDSGTTTFYYYAKFTSKGAKLTITNNNGIVGHGYLFRIDNGRDVSMYVSIVGIGCVTVSRLPIGETYTVTQLNSWSYDSHDNTSYRIVPISDVNVTYEAIFNNSDQNVNWLRGEVSGQY